MDPLTIVAAYVQIVGLLADFTSSRGQRDTVELKEFTEWLSTHGHNEIVKLIDRNQATSVSIKAALSEGTEAILARLGDLERQLAIASIGQGAFGKMALAIVPTANLSEQQIAILLAYEERTAGTALLHHGDEGQGLLFMDGNSQVGYGPEDPRFFEIDLADLVQQGFLKASFNGAGKKLFLLTRHGHELAKRLDERARAV